MSGTELKQRLAAILAADVSGYSRLMSANERATVAALDAGRAVFRSQIQAHQGRVIDMAGDSVLAVFETAIGAVSAALAVQQEINASSNAVPEEQRMRFRIGVHLGDVIEKSDGTVYGDGVNIAARLEGLAAPGGITVSASIRTAVQGKLGASFEDRGEQKVKNIPEPVRAYRVKVEGEAAPAAGHAAREAGNAPRESPAIAVLPFSNMSGDPEQEYFSDGITEDIITDLSKLSGLLVIARNSSATYKGRAVDVRQVGREFKVSHVLEGSVRRAGGRVRITSQLLDAGTGHHIWAERYDRNIEDIFAVQDEITREIVAALDVKLLRGEQATVWRQSLRHPEALDAYYRGLDYLNRVTREANDQAVHCFEQVTKLDPESPLGYLGTAWTHLSASRYGWTGSPPESLKRAAQLAGKALQLDESCADAHALLGYYHLLAHQHDQAIAAGERSVALSPSHADNAANLACSYAVSGKPAEAVALMQRAIRLSPIYPTWYLNILGFGQYQTGQYDGAESILKLALEREPAYADCRLILAAIHHARGRVDEARREIQEVTRHSPGFKLRDFEARLVIVKDRDMLARLLDILRQLGLS
ncbi:MAG: tetratricopeptide repeat protein [Burkholderiales bacterium]